MTSFANLWLRYAFILNAVLASHIVALFVIAYVSSFQEVYGEQQVNGDPVVFQHFFYFYVEPWALIAYAAIPNVLLLVILRIIHTRKSRFVS